MSFLAPAAFALAVLLPVIVALYLLKLRRSEQAVSSVYLWQRLVRDVQANAPWQRLRRNLLLYLQLLFLAALILALARPFTRTEGLAGRAAILILDTSASMAATDEVPSRLAATQAQARRLVDGLPQEARVTVITAGQAARVLVASSQDRRQVHLAIDSARVEAGSRPGSVATALELASAIAARQPETEIVLFSDGRVALPADGHGGSPPQVRYVRIGHSDENQAIGALSLQTAAGAGRLAAFAQVVNYGSQSAVRRLALYADGQLANAYDLQLSPGETRAVIAGDLPPGTALLDARLEGADVLPLDDHAWAVAPPAEPAAVTLVSEGSLFLETALALLPGVQLTVVKPQDWDVAHDERGDWGSGVTILDAYVPLTATLPAGDLLFIAPPRSTALFTVTGTVEQPLPRAVGEAAGSGADPLLAHVDLANVSILEAVRLTLPAWARLVVAGDPQPGSLSPPGGGPLAEHMAPLLLAGEVGGRRLAVLAFDLHHSDLPLQAAFPLLLANLMDWLAPEGGRGGVPLQVEPGSAVLLAPPLLGDDGGSQQAVVTVTGPDGSAVRLVPAEGAEQGSEQGQATFAETHELGVYEVTWADRQLSRFAVNLFSPQESDVRPAEILPVAGAPAEVEAEAAGAQALQGRREWWRLLAWAALALLILEWLIYYRATVKRIWDSGFSILDSVLPGAKRTPKSKIHNQKSRIE